jgi:hypothetical protein
VQCMCRCVAVNKSLRPREDGMNVHCFWGARRLRQTFVACATGCKQVPTQPKRCSVNVVRPVNRQVCHLGVLHLVHADDVTGV